ncbi:hypothetical protein [Tissierella sp. Yu-01]|uniref:hypothetical protein n=1 Tax=Tissierella sp. Yu-01 TaxID=3035694 RepID=UPI00240E5086|nr:hypothetical protein [Tissierella sp. Yu-01]WFA09397.1 hypothetical protein P3962_02140 [Tissierella sp. Yu-01]
MNKIMEKIKDILYDSLDYVIMLAIVVIVVAIIGWRLDILFAKDVSETGGKNEVVVVGPEKEIHNEEKPDEDEEDDNEGKESPNEETPDETTVETPIEQPVNNGEPIKITIPAGSLPGKIGSILADNGLIDSSKDFIAKAVELKLDTKLKSGNYSIPTGSSYEEILNILTK